MEEFVSILGAIFSSLSFFPQAYKTIRSRNTDGISLMMYIILTSGALCWLAYGIMVGSYALIANNICVISCALVILYIKIRHLHQQRHLPPLVQDTPLAPVPHIPTLP